MTSSEALPDDVGKFGSFQAFLHECNIKSDGNTSLQVIADTALAIKNTKNATEQFH